MSSASFITTPTVCVHQIHLYLWLHETVKNARVCRTWQTVLSDDTFWKIACAIRQLVALNKLSYKQQATFLRAEARVNENVTGIEMQQCDGKIGEYREPAVAITIDTSSKEMQMLWCKKLSITAQSPLLYRWIPLKYFLNRDGSYKTQADQIIVEYPTCDQLFTLCIEKDGLNFCDVIKHKVTIGLHRGDMDNRMITYVKKVAKNLTTKVTIGK